jgi:hypothetical protein
MDRRIVHRFLCAAVSMAGTASSMTMTATSWSQTAPATTTPPATTTTPEAESPPQPTRVRFEELFHVDLRDRKLSIAMTPPKAVEAEIAAGGSAPITVVDSDAIDWRINVTPGGDADGRGARGAAGKLERDGAGGYTRFSVAPPPDYMPDRWAGLQLTSVTADDDLTLTGSGRVGRTFVTVEYQQGRALNAARLKVERTRRPGGGRPLHEFTAPDLLQMWNDHQRECRMYLVPLLSVIAPRENVLRPRAGDVYRAFNDIPADAAMTRQVAALLPQLEAESPAARDAASAKIEALGPPGVLALLRMDRAEWTPEQTARLATIVQRQSTLSDPTAWRRDIYFLTDCLDDADPAVRQAALRAVNAVAGREVDFDVDAASQARLAAAQEILRTLESTVGGR